MKNLMMLALCAFVANAAMAAEKIGDLWYKLNTVEKTASVTYSLDYSQLKSVQVPPQVQFDGDTYTVTSIDAAAFFRYSGLTSVAIPSSVTSIGASAFSGCSGLTSVAIPSGVTSIGDYAFYGCSGLTSVAIPSGVTSIGASAFYGCSGLTSVAIPSGVTSIGDSAFSGCRGLTSVAIPSGVTSIGECAFSGCRGLTSVAIPSSVTSIGDEAFCNCMLLTKVSLAPKAVSIGVGAFDGCLDLKTVVVSDWELFAKTDWSSWFGPSVEVVGPVTKQEAESVSFAVVPMSGDKVVSAADYESACKVYGLTPKTAPQVVQEGEIAVTKESIAAAKAETVQIVNGQIELSVSVSTNADITAEVPWAPVKFTPDTQIGLSSDGTKLILPIPVAAQSGFMILQSGDAKVSEGGRGPVTGEPWYKPTVED